MPPSVSVVIPVYNQAQLTRACGASLAQNSRVARELIVVDNASSDDTPQVLDELGTKLRGQGWDFSVLRNTENQGFGRACNQGIRVARGEFVAVLNNDTWLMPGWDEALAHRARELRADMVGPYYDERPFDPRATPARAARFAARNQGKARRAWVSILMFFPRSTLNDLGLFDERFFVTYEDADLRERMERAGMRYYQVGDCFIWHRSKGTRDHADLPSDYEKEGLRLFMDKWGYDPRTREATRHARLTCRWRRIKDRLGYL